VLTIGTIDALSVMKRRNDKNNITTTPLYNQVSASMNSPPSSRGYLDVAAVAKLAATAPPQAGRLIEDLGINGLKSTLPLRL